MSHQRYELQPIGRVEALDGTPIVDVKPVLDRNLER
jgi:tRNA (Thr-GGU) A37 N-methylase